MTDSASRLASTTEIAAAFLANHKLDMGQVADLIVSIGASFDRVAAVPNALQPVRSDHPGAAAIRKSIGQEHLISFEDGQAYKMLKRHLSSRGLTPEAYRAKWGLPGHYPMVAPAYSAARSEVAHRIGLGRGGRRRPAEAAGKAISTPAPRPRGRPPKAQPAPAKAARSKPSGPKASARTTAHLSRPKTKPVKSKPARSKPKG